MRLKVLSAILIACITVVAIMRINAYQKRQTLIGHQSKINQPNILNTNSAKERLPAILLDQDRTEKPSTGGPPAPMMIPAA